METFIKSQIHNFLLECIWDPLTNTCKDPFDPANYPDLVDEDDDDDDFGEC